MYQSLTIIGRLGRDPEMRYMPNGDPVTSFSVATDRAYNDKNGQKVKETTWFRVSVFGKQADNANQYLHKGSMVLVEGRLRTDPKTRQTPLIFLSATYVTPDDKQFAISLGAVRFIEKPREEKLLDSLRLNQATLDKIGSHEGDELFLASMGIYIFKWDVLRKVLLQDHEDEASEKDFGKTVALFSELHRKENKEKSINL